jgi:DNA-binding NarL/FixJ family response regulator
MRAAPGAVTVVSMGDSEEPISVLIADDQALVRAGFHAILELQPGITVCGEATDGRDAIDIARKRHPTVVLMDIQMPDIDGLEATRRIVAEAGDRPIAVLMLTTFDLNEYVYEALRAGASGFLLKDVLPEDLVAAVRVVAAGDGLIAPTITKRLIEQFARAASNCSRRASSRCSRSWHGGCPTRR